MRGWWDRSEACSVAVMGNWRVGIAMVVVAVCVVAGGWLAGASSGSSRWVAPTALNLGGGSRVESMSHLRLTVYEGEGIPRKHYAFVCHPSEGKPSSAEAGLCAALEDYLPRRIATRRWCGCGVGFHRVMVSGTLDGQRIQSPVEVSWCGVCGLAKLARADLETVYRMVGIPPMAS